VADDSNRRPLLEVDVAPGDEPVISLRGDLDPHTAPLLESALAEAADTSGVTRVVIDLAGVSFIDSSGLRVFVAGRELLAGKGAALALRNPNRNTRRLLDITGLGEIIDVEDER
jgi:anti-anti-sigma factor